MKIIFGLFLSLLVLFGQELRVGSENAYKPFAYIDEQGNATGFDNEVMKIIASYIQDARVQFVPVAWNAIFSGLDSAKFDIIANQITKTKEREEKYLFSTKPYFYDISTIITLDERKIKDINELQNAKIGVTVGSNHAKNLEEYLKNHPQFQAQIVYYKTSPTLVADLKNKRIAAIVNNPIAAQDYAKAQNIGINVSELYFEKVPVYLLLRKDSVDLLKIIDEALGKALDEGKISELSLQYFGIDLSK
ncbi:transporter substrate-binding domain-containing protein [Campylobacter sp. MIT 21-1685]|uniref:transporter substrate-binding domain-containing protein n=1 Tax=unclassified Campylobacter TaxID=2593542 RepID=UPI00224B9465|nr:MULTISPECIES: transporter substrate-binding domain-containing protein [unclassified Campylobacter]MCX2682529.1 transporter substrate-binding domain-containing protein [Campylobacter sp. MIT 21-1684]MCX2750758.1 transporter substrate-binding domain-containing protein [Campylobacter sp. MIT 21-1682]MCX2807010.1 transporter substrate-binding domain-containing protein [Campylobacter sp. MIT 21-1685]